MKLFRHIFEKPHAFAPSFYMDIYGNLFLRLPWLNSTLSHVLQVFAIEFVKFANGFVQFAVEFVTF